MGREDSSKIRTLKVGSLQHIWLRWGCLSVGVGVTLTKAVYVAPALRRCWLSLPGNRPRPGLLPAARCAAVGAELGCTRSGHAARWPQEPAGARDREVLPNPSVSDAAAETTYLGLLRSPDPPSSRSSSQGRPEPIS